MVLVTRIISFFLLAISNRHCRVSAPSSRAAFVILIPNYLGFDCVLAQEGFCSAFGPAIPDLGGSKGWSCQLRRCQGLLMTLWDCEKTFRSPDINKGLHRLQVLVIQKVEELADIDKMYETGVELFISA